MTIITFRSPLKVTDTDQVFAINLPRILIQTFIPDFKIINYLHKKSAEKGVADYFIAIRVVPSSHGLSHCHAHRKSTKTVTIGAYPDEIIPFGAFVHFLYFTIFAVSSFSFGYLYSLFRSGQWVGGAHYIAGFTTKAGYLLTAFCAPVSFNLI